MIRYADYQTMGMDSQEQADYDRGVQALQYFHERAQSYDAYKLTFDELLQALGPGKNQATIDIYVQGIGIQVKILEDYGRADELRDIMYAIAEKGQGAVPSDYNVWHNAFGKALAEQDYLAAIVYTIKESAAPIADVLVDTGDIVRSGLKGFANLSRLTPYIVPAVVVIGFGLFIYLNKEKITGIAKLAGSRLESKARGALA